MWVISIIFDVPIQWQKGVGGMHPSRAGAQLLASQLVFQTCQLQSPAPKHQCYSSAEVPGQSQMWAGSVVAAP